MNLRHMNTSIERDELPSFQDEEYTSIIPTTGEYLFFINLDLHDKVSLQFLLLTFLLTAVI